MTVWLTGESGTGFPGVPARASRPATDARLTSAPAASAGHVASAGPAQRSWLSLSAADQRHDWTAAAHPGAAEVTSAASGPRELTPDYHSVEELISDLRSSARWSSVSPLPATLSPDLFGLLEDVPPPPFLEGHDYSDLSAGRSIGFLRALDMVKPTPPSHADMEPAALTDHADRVEVIERSDAERTSWAPETHYCFEPNEQIRIRPLPRTSVMPWILFSIWLGGPLGTSGKMGDFRQTFGAANAEIETGLFADKILLTDVPRSSFEQARHIGSSSPESADQFGEVRSMLEWAEQNDIMLVNVKEVFNAAYPMRLGSHFLTEMNKQTPPGCAAASDILRLNFLYRFGGVYSDGDNIVSHLIDVPDVVKSANGFSVYADGRGNVGNMLIVASKEHPFVGEYIEEISRQYELPQSWMIIPSKQLPKSSDGGGMRARRHSVMNRTGPGILHNVLENHGYNVRYDIVQLMGIEIGHANSWLRGPLDAKSGLDRKSPKSWDRSSTLKMAQKVVQTLIRNLLHNRPGDLHLTAVAEVIEKHPRSALIWTAILSFIASHRDFAERITHVTIERHFDEEIRRVNLPGAAEELLDISTDGREFTYGDYQYRATMAVSMARPVTSAVSVSGRLSPAGRPPHIDRDPAPGVRWISSSHSDFDPDGNPISDDRRACVSVSVLRIEARR